MDRFILQTTYCNYNYGSILQCFALQEFYKSHGIKCILVKRKFEKVERVLYSVFRRIDYYLLCFKYKNVAEQNRKQKKSADNSVKLISNESIKLMDDFIAKNINIKTETFRKLKELARKEECIYCVAGSDQIWNSSRIFLEPMYFLRFAPNNKKIAFSPSFGGSEVSDYNIKRYRKYISEFSKISVREKSGIKIIKELIDKESIQLMDPVFLLKKDKWLSMVNNKQLINGKYAFSFFLDKPNNNAIRILSTLQENGYKIIELGYRHKEIRNALFYNGDPLDFISAIANSHVVCTDSFHATAFSVLLHKRFYSFQRNYQAQDQSSRLIDFLTSINLIERFNRVELSDSSIDFSLADSLIEKNYRIVKEFLEI